MRKFIISILLTISLAIHGQWKIGVGVGPSINLYPYQERDLLFASFLSPGDFQFEDKVSWGISAGVYGQYDFNDYIGLRVDLNWTQKNIYRGYKRTNIHVVNKTTNNYLQLPFMATGGIFLGRFKLYLNAGLYGAYWISSSINSNMEISDAKGINNAYDNRFDIGLVGGGGCGYYLSNSLSVQIETHCYYSTVSTKKELNGIKNPRYNLTWVIQPSLCYSF